MRFPQVDPIPVPAPVWLMKALSLLTLTLHFFAVQVLIGSLVAVCYFSFRGTARKSSGHLTAAAVIAKRLPIVMTYVINFGVPPLLFAQVLYGRALYTSSILIGAMWISVIPLLMLAYWLLYRTADRAAVGKPVGWHALLALIVAAGVGDIYATNMTLMLRPEVWQQMYAKTASGVQQPPHDPTALPRWLFVILGGLLLGGMWTLLYSNLKEIDSDAKRVLKRTGAAFASIGALLQLGTGYWVHYTQAAAIQEGLKAPFYTVGAGLWGLGVVLALLIALTQLGSGPSKALIGFGGCVSGFLGLAGAVIYRDGIRDLTLLGKGYDVWKRTEYSNWFVIGLFLLLFVIGAVAIGWLGMVMKNAKPVQEQVTV